MLQQTQVATVINYFERFVTRFPTVAELADGAADEVMALWAGLGYYSRARNLHQAAKQCVAEHQGELPRDLEMLMNLPGIGRSTAGAILAQSFGDRHPILDGNVKRVLCRFHAVEGWPGKAAVSKELWRLAESHTPSERVADYTQAIMDLGATVCARRPDCRRCPVRPACQAFTSEQVLAFPFRKPRKALPEKSADLLFISDRQGRLLLQRRPPSGIWGGLWSPPMVDSALPEPAAVAPRIKHTFSHYHLWLRPVRTEGFDRLSDVEQRWLDQAAVSQLGLPKPIKLLVNQYFTEQLKWQEPSPA